MIWAGDVGGTKTVRAASDSGVGTVNNVIQQTLGTEGKASLDAIVAAVVSLRESATAATPTSASQAPSSTGSARPRTRRRPSLQPASTGQCGSRGAQQPGGDFVGGAWHLRCCRPCARAHSWRLLDTKAASKSSTPALPW